MRIISYACIWTFFPIVAIGENISELKVKAQEGDTEAQFKLGEYFNTGDGVGKDQVEAVNWYSKAADNGHAKAQLKLGEFYLNGTNVEQDTSKGTRLLRQSAEQGNLEAQKSLAFLLRTLYRSGLYGKTGATFALEAVDLYRKAAEQGDADAQNSLAVSYADGEGVQKDDFEAVKWFRRAAEQGISAAQLNLGRCYAEGKGVSKDEAEAIKWYREAAEQGSTAAQFKLGFCYLKGIGVPKDEVEAVKWYRMAAEQGDADAQHNLGFAYGNGIGVSKDEVEAVKWYRMAAEQGYLSAQMNLGLCYLKGIGVPKDEVEAVKWYRMAAEQGHADAQLSLGVFYAQGKGVKQDFNQARFWLQKSSDQGYKTANEVLDLILKNTQQQKLALLIANSKYSQFGRLANTDSDAQKLAKVLNSLGFQVSILKNASKEQMLDALKDFEAKVRGTNAIAFFHYGGHGVQVEGKNYLIPADAEIPDERRVSTRAVDLDEVIAVLDSAKPKASVLVVDACRHNPLPATATRSATRGLAVVGRKPKNSVIIYAAEAGNEALDGLFTPILAENLQEHSDKSLNQIMQKVRAEVFERSKGAQTPGEYNQLFEELYFSKTQENAAR